MVTGEGLNVGIRHVPPVRPTRRFRPQVMVPVIIAKVEYMEQETRIN